MKRELKIKYADLRQVKERVRVVKYALEEMEEAAERFAGLLGEQESEAVRTLLELRSGLKKDVQDCHDQLEALEELLSGYIREMTEAVRPVNEEQETVVDRNDIWWNMEQIYDNIEKNLPIANGFAVLTYHQAETVVNEPHIREEMEAEEISALWEAYHRALRERENRRENYRKLEGFCSGEARWAQERLEALYEEIERIYRNHVVVYENTDDAYKREAEALYNRYSSPQERRLRAGKSIGRGAVSLLEGVRDAVWDTAKGIGSLVVFTKKVEIANATIITDELGITPRWMTRIREEVAETYKGVGRALQNPGRVLAAIGQGATDTLEEKGIAYAGSYVVTDVLIGIALDKGLSKLGKAGKVKLVNKLDEVSDAGKVVNEIGEAVIRYGDEVGEAAVKRGLNSSFAKNIDDILAKYELSLDEFNALRLRDVSTLSDAEKATLKAIRESIPMPDTDTVMQKVIPASDIEKYLDGTYTQVGGYVTRAEDVSQLSTYNDLYDSLRLDYPGSVYKPADDSIGVIRYTTDEASKISIPYGTEMGGTVTEAPPFTGNGFTKATNGEIIPEFKCDDYLNLDDGAQLIEISKDGIETLKAVYSKIDKMFIPVE